MKTKNATITSVPRPEGDDAFLLMEGLRVEYTSEGKVIQAVNGVDLAVRRGRSLGLVGETGAGKTTIAKTIMRILPEVSARVRDGRVWLEDDDLLALSEQEMRKIRGQRISMIFQDPMTALNPVQRVGDQIAEVVHLHNEVTKAQAALKAREMLELVGIPGNRASEYPHQFSGGMKQRVVIAIALACNPSLLIADEPTTALDVTIQAQVLDMIEKLKTELNTSMLLITHDLGVVGEICDDVAVIYAGQIVESGSKEDIFLGAAHPYTRGLFAAIPSLDTDTDRLVPIEGLPPDPTNLPTGCKFHPRCPYATAECAEAEVEMAEVAPGHFARCIYAGELDTRGKGEA